MSLLISDTRLFKQKVDRKEEEEEEAGMQQAGEEAEKDGAAEEQRDKGEMKWQKKRDTCSRIISVTSTTCYKSFLKKSI